MVDQGGIIQLAGIPPYLRALVARSSPDMAALLIRLEKRGQSIQKETVEIISKRNALYVYLQENLVPNDEA